MQKPKNQVSIENNAYHSKINLNSICDSYNERLKKLLNDTNTDYAPLELGQPCKHLLDCGIPDLPIQISVRRLIDKKLQLNHPFSLVSVVHMPAYLREPIAVFQSKTRQDVKVILTEMEEKGINFVVAPELQKLKGSQDVNDIRSVYPKDNIKDILRWIAEDDLLEYCCKEKALNWLGKQQSNSVEVAKLIKDSVKIIQKK